MDRYTLHLTQLANLTNKQLQAANNEKSNDQMDHRRRQWANQLLRSISPAPHLEYDPPQPPDDNFPRYMPKSQPYVYKGGEALIILGLDKETNRDGIFRFFLPQKEPKKSEKKEPDGPEKEKKSIFLKARDYIKENCTPREKKKYSTESTEREFRSYLLQANLHKKMREHGLLNYGYIPEVYSYSEAPQLYCIMEYIPGEDLLEWCGKNSDRDVLELFLKLLRLVEQVVHRFTVVHSDIAPNNIMVHNDRPVLIDYGLAKSMNEPSSITSRSTAAGKPLYAPREQMEEFYRRSYKVDLYNLGNTLWTMWARNEPDSSHVLSYVDENGNLQYDYDEIRRLFKPEIFKYKELRKIFEKATHPDQELRYQDVTDFRKDVELFFVRRYALADTQKNVRCEKNCRGLMVLHKAFLKISKKQEAQDKHLADLEGKVVKTVELFTTESESDKPKESEGEKS